MLNRLPRRLLHRRLERLSAGRLVLDEEGGRTTFGALPADAPLDVVLTIRSREFYPAVVFDGSIGAAEAYLRGDWECRDLVGLFRLLVRDSEVLAGLEGGAARLGGWLQRLGHALRSNTRRGSRRNIAAHYDLGNDFYRLFLDESLAYSCGVFMTPESTLEEASLAKFERVCRLLGLRPGMEVIEIGCGWGGFALHAAREHGCRVTAVTISRAQYEVAQARIRDVGLADRITLRLCDYRDLEGQFDRLVSIEMIEAVGHRHLPRFFEVCGKLLRPDGALCLQAITLADRLYDAYLRTPDFINRLVFPGGCVPSIEALARAIKRSSDLTLVRVDDLTPHYVRTLQAWRARFLARRDDVRALGYDERFLRLWEYYLCYCEAGFAERATADLQVVLAKPLWRGDLSPSAWREGF